jgi:hypothetical protein
MTYNVLLTRKVADIFIPSVDILDDTKACEQLLDLHCEQKLLFNSLLTGDANFEDMLEALEAYVGVSQMDEYISEIEVGVEDLNLLCNGMLLD